MLSCPQEGSRLFGGFIIERLFECVHTNGIENFWSCLKRGLNGTYVSVEPMHLDRYVNEQVFRFNLRHKHTDAARFKAVLKDVVGRRLTYAELTGRTAPEVF
jgi:hypothetical protein